MILIDENRPQWKGNFHAHTTLSDGTETPERVVSIYKENGYNFLAISDHERFFDSDEFDTDNFKLLGAIECAIKPNPSGKWALGKNHLSIHLHGIHDYTVDTKINELKHGEVLQQQIDEGIDSWQRQIDFMHDKNLIVFLNHPNWSRIRPENMTSLTGYIATEVYNHGCAVAECTGFSEFEWDYCTRNGKMVFGIATDDTHFYSGNTNQACGGFTMVQCNKLDKKELCMAIKCGSMYASAGPLIHDMRIINGQLQMKFTPAQYVNIITNDGYAPVQRNINGNAIESIKWDIDSKQKSFRVEIVAPDGKKAWSQPVLIP